uniref:Gypsy retrotransposon integrase-like protein 1 n=1 Tax=Sphenodon punctatus TaxID=8508 RepID=A0A8D0GEN3_SPHPU
QIHVGYNQSLYWHQDAYRLTLFYVGKDRKQMRLVIVSDEEKKKVLRKCHENAAGAHHGISRTLTLVESNYYWTSITNDVKQWVWFISIEYFCLDPYCLLNCGCYSEWKHKSMLLLSFKINQELFKLFGIKEMILSYPQRDYANETVCKTIKAFLHKYCLEHTSDWDDHLSAIAYAYNLINLEPDQNTPYFQMFNRNPYIPESSDVLKEGESKCLFSRILDAIKQAERRMEEKKVSGCQNVKNILDEQQSGNKVIVKKKPKQLNPFLLKVGHEVLRQKKNWWKGGRFQSEWVGPCIIDYITDNGCAILRDTTGLRLKRPIKMSHLKPYVRGSNDQDSHYLLQGAIVVDHDYVGLCENSPVLSQQDVLAEGGAHPHSDLVPCKEHASSECKCCAVSEFTDDHSAKPASREMLELLLEGVVNASLQEGRVLGCLK